MGELKQNYYGSLCTEMYEILHEQAPLDELNFYLSYAEKGKKILEPCAAADDSWFLFQSVALTSAGWTYRKKCWRN